MSEQTIKKTMEVPVQQLRCDKCGAVANDAVESTGWLCCHEVTRPEVPSLLGPFEAPSLDAALSFTQVLAARLRPELKTQHLCISCKALLTQFVGETPVPKRPALTPEQATTATDELLRGVKLLASALGKAEALDVSALDQFPLTAEALDKLGPGGTKLAALLRTHAPATASPDLSTPFDEQDRDEQGREASR